jgi:hypothetical protein
MRPETEGMLAIPQGLHDRPAFAPNVPDDCLANPVP